MGFHTMMRKLQNYFCEMLNQTCQALRP